VLAVGTIFGFRPSTGFIQVYIAGLILVPIIITFWLFLFNSGTSRVDEYAIEFSDKEIIYLHMAEKDTLAWSDYEKYEISGIIRKTLTIYGKAKKLPIELMLFNSEQRKNIISTLDERC